MAQLNYLSKKNPRQHGLLPLLAKAFGGHDKRGHA